MWCPNCKMEYRKGVKVCADCGTELVEGTEADFCVVDLCEFKEEQVADRFLEYLQYSGLEQAEKMEKEGDSVYVVTVLEKQRKRAEKLFRGFLLAMKEDQETEILQELQKQRSQEETADREFEDSDNHPEEVEDIPETEYNWDQEDPETEAEEDIFDRNAEVQKQAENLLLSEEAEEDTVDLLYTSTESYVTKEEEYKDLKFSGITFIVFSILGAVFLTLCQLEILPIHYENFVLFVIAAVFVAFFVIGIVSMVKASKIKLKIPAEEAKIKEIYDFLDAELSQEILNGWRDSEVSDVENDLLITSHIRASLIRAYPEESVVFLEYLADQYYGDRYVEQLNAEEQEEDPAEAAGYEEAEEVDTEE